MIERPRSFFHPHFGNRTLSQHAFSLMLVSVGLFAANVTRGDVVTSDVVTVTQFGGPFPQDPKNDFGTVSLGTDPPNSGEYYQTLTTNAPVVVGSNLTQAIVMEGTGTLAANSRDVPESVFFHEMNVIDLPCDFDLLIEANYAADTQFPGSNSSLTVGVGQKIVPASASSVDITNGSTAGSTSFSKE